MDSKATEINVLFPAVKAVFFDMDGVIFDSMSRHAKAWSQAMALEGLPFSEYQVYLQEGRTGSGTVTDVYLAHHHHPRCPLCRWRYRRSEARDDPRRRQGDRL